jgi:flavin-dependent dehydrogenase
LKGHVILVLISAGMDIKKSRRTALKIAIAGAGTTGAYCYRLLSIQGLDVHVYDGKHKPACGISPCAWGTSRGFMELTSVAGLTPEKYILQRFDSVLMDDFAVKGELMTFDKPAFIRDLLEGAEIRKGPIQVGRYDRIIDATGVSRSFLPSINNDLLLPAIQCRIKTEERLENRIKLGGVGYAWCFPLGARGYHIGCGTLIGDPAIYFKQLNWLPKESSHPHTKTLCACTGTLRLTGPHHSQPFSVDGASQGIWGVGESIGCVAPLAGDGIVPGMKSVQLLLKHWDDPMGYSRAILKEFEWMKTERHVIDKLLASSPLGIRDAWVLMKNSKRMALQVGLKQAIKFLRALRK